MLNVTNKSIMLNVIMLSVIMLNVIVLNVMAQFFITKDWAQYAEVLHSSRIERFEGTKPRHLFWSIVILIANNGAKTLSSMTLNITTLSITMLSIMKISITTLSIMTLSILTFSIKINKMWHSLITLSMIAEQWCLCWISEMLIVTYSRYAECDYDKCSYAECCAVQMVVSILMKLKVKCKHRKTKTILGHLKNNTKC
jgi:hypothetical protein